MDDGAAGLGSGSSDDGFISWLAALTETSNAGQAAQSRVEVLAVQAQGELDGGGDVPLAAVDLDTLLLPPAAFQPAQDVAQQPLPALQDGPAPQQRNVQLQYTTAAPPAPQQHQQHYHLQHLHQQQHLVRQQLQHVYPGPQPACAQPLPAQSPVGSQSAMELQPLSSWQQHMSQQQQQQQQQPPQQLQPMHLLPQPFVQSPPEMLQNAGGSESVAAGLAARAGLQSSAALAPAAPPPPSTAAASAPSEIPHTNSSGSGGGIEAAAAQPAGTPAASQGPAGGPTVAEAAEMHPEIAKAMRKQQLLQEKNRRAQARFRERQKSKASEQQEQIAELARRVEALEMERAELASKNAMLQKLATIRRDTSAGGAEAKPATISGNTSAGGAEAESAEDDAEVAAQLADMLNRLRPPDSPGRAGLTAANVGNVSIEEMTARIKDGVQEVGMLLLGGGENSASPAGQRLAAIMGAYSQLVISYCTKRTPRMRTLEMALFNAQTQQHGRPTPEHWRRVMETIGLSEEQRAALQRARRNLLGAMSQLMAQRREVISLLVAGMPSATDDINNAIGFDKASQASRQLRQNLEEEGCHVAEFLLTVGQTIAPLQQARWLVESYPFEPDYLSLCNVLAEDADEGACAAAEADTATWMTGLDGSGGGAGLLPPGSAFRMLAQGGNSVPMQGVVSAATPPPAASLPQQPHGN